MSFCDESRREESRVKPMFARVATRYDRINAAMCFGLDRVWRGRLAKSVLLSAEKNAPFIDIACGSGDVALALLNRGAKKIVCADFCPEMLELAKGKATRAGFGANAEFVCADCENLPFPDAGFGGATMAFGFRNFKNRAVCLAEIFRVMKPGARLGVLEVARAPKLLRPIQNMFMRHFVPNLAKILGGSKEDYVYLAETTRDFPDQKALKKKFESSGFVNVKSRPMAFGMVALTLAEKP